MCGRYVITVTLDDLQEHYHAVRAAGGDAIPCYNIAPSMHMPVVGKGADGERGIRPLRWGFRPHWAKADAPIPINAKVESVFEKNYYRSAIKRQRCLVPATGWYEWTQDANGKQPHLIQPRDQNIFSFAGIWSKYVLDDEQVEGYAIIVGPASDEIAGIHDRQPLIVLPEDYDEWLDHQNDDLDRLAKMLRHQLDNYQQRPVSKRVNSPENQDAGLLDISTVGVRA